ncbi:PIN domain-containing protein [Cupriavidus sp. Marseille-Q8015]
MQTLHALKNREGLPVYLVDTNVISEARKGQRANLGVAAFFHEAAQRDDDIYLSVITVGELRRGVELVRHRGDTVQADVLGAWVASVLEDYAQNILPIDVDVSQVWGCLRVPHPEHALDKLIAATALVHDLAVVTRNVDDFRGLGLHVINPFD